MIVHEQDLISFSPIRSIAYSSYRIIPLNIASCGCRVQTNGVRNAPCYLLSSIYQDRSEDPQRFEGVRAISSYFGPSRRMHLLGRFIGLHKMMILRKRRPIAKPRGSIFSNSPVGTPGVRVQYIQSICAGDL